VVFCSATFFCARKNAPHFSLSGAKKRQLQPERYVPFFWNWSKPDMMIKRLLLKISKIRPTTFRRNEPID
jgi:hypothetical protein